MGFPRLVSNVRYWGFRILVTKSRRRRGEFDIENVPKLIIDAFCAKQFGKWDKHSKYCSLGLYDNDTIDTVCLLLVRGERSSGPDATSVEIHGWSEGESIEF
jgi:hypothetical protein